MTGEVQEILKQINNYLALNALFLICTLIYIYIFSLSHGTFLFKSRNLFEEKFNNFIKLKLVDFMCR